MDIQVTPTQFLLGIITVLVPQIFMLIKSFRDNKLQKEVAKLQAELQKPLTSAQAESAMGDALEKLGQAYDRALATIASQDKELAGLRPLILEIAMTKQEATQTQLDKDDWKAHAIKLKEQLEENRIIPLAFKRQSLEGDSEKMRAITQAQVDKYIGGKEKNGNGDIP